jgi:hypothetical protein
MLRLRSRTDLRRSASLMASGCDSRWLGPLKSIGAVRLFGDSGGVWPGKKRVR